MAKKSVYTDEVKAKMKADYLAAENEAERMEIVEAVADELGVSPASVRGVMTRAQYYIKKVYKRKTGEAVAKKDTIAGQIAPYLDMTAEQAGSLAKANRVVLTAILHKFAGDANTIKVLTEGEPES